MSRKLEEKLIEDLGVDGWIILKFILNNTVDVNWIRLVHNTDQLRAFVKMAMNLRVS
jgi:hypothetical protein